MSDYFLLPTIYSISVNVVTHRFSQAEFSRMLTSILSGHTFTAKLAHEGTVLKYAI
jgi:hypothetical protein